MLRVLTASIESAAELSTLSCSKFTKFTDKRYVVFHQEIRILIISQTFSQDSIRECFS